MDTATIAKMYEDALLGQPTRTLVSTSSVQEVRHGDRAVTLVSVEQWQPAPSAKRGLFVLHEPASFGSYVARHANPQTCVWVDPKAVDSQVTAVLDDHGDERPGHGNHSAHLALRPTTEWQAWVDALDRPLTQRDFALLVDQQTDTIIDPDGAELAQWVDSLHATSSSTVSESGALTNGNRRITFQASTAIRTGTAGVEFPTKLKLRILPFAGLDEPYDVIARVLIDADPGERLKIRVSIPAADEMIRDAVAQAVDMAGQFWPQGTTVYYGRPTPRANRLGPVQVRVGS